MRKLIKTPDISLEKIDLEYRGRVKVMEDVFETIEHFIFFKEILNDAIIYLCSCFKNIK